MHLASTIILSIILPLQIISRQTTTTTTTTKQYAFDVLSRWKWQASVYAQGESMFSTCLPQAVTVEGVCDATSSALDVSAVPLERCVVRLETRYSLTSIHLLFIIFYWKYICADTVPLPLLSLCRLRYSIHHQSSSRAICQHTPIQIIL